MSVLPAFALLLCVANTIAKVDKKPAPEAGKTPGPDADSKPETSQIDFQKLGVEMSEDIRRFTSEARRGMKLADIAESAREIETKAASILEHLEDSADSCQSGMVIKMAAARTGSHEVLTLLQANDKLSVLTGRLSLSLAFLESVAELMEDELSRSPDIRGHLAALVFGADMADDIVQNTEELVNQTVKTYNDNSAVRRSWEVNAEPIYNKGLGVRAGATWESKSGNTIVSLAPSWTPGSGFQLGGRISFKF